MPRLTHSEHMKDEEGREGEGIILFCRAGALGNKGGNILKINKRNERRLPGKAKYLVKGKLFIGKFL